MLLFRQASLAFLALVARRLTPKFQFRSAASSASTPSPPATRTTPTSASTPTATSSWCGRAHQDGIASVSSRAASTPRVSLQGGQFQVNTYTTDVPERSRSIDVDADGDFVDRLGQPGAGRRQDGVFARRFSSAGARAGRRVPGQHHDGEHPEQRAVASDARRRLRGRLEQFRPGRELGSASSRAASTRRALRWARSSRSTPSPPAPSRHPACRHGCRRRLRRGLGERRSGRHSATASSAAL